MPRKIIFSVIDLFKEKKIETPSYDAFSKTITKHFRAFEGTTLSRLKVIISSDHIQALDTLLVQPNDQSKSRPLLTTLKYISHSAKPGQIKNSVNNFLKLKAIFTQVSGLLDSVKLSNESIAYYGTLVIKYQLSQINQLQEDHRKYLYLLCFVVHQYKRWQDQFFLLFKKAVRAFENKAKKASESVYSEHVGTKHELTDNVISGLQDYKAILDQIRYKAQNKQISDALFRKYVHYLLNKADKQELETANEDAIKLLELMEKEKSKSGYYEAHTNHSRKLQNRVSLILKHLDFIYEPSASDLKDAIDYYQATNKITQTAAPDSFLDDEQHQYVYNDVQFNLSLYKSMLYVNAFNAVNSGEISLKNSYKYLPIKAYMINEEDWLKNKKAILELVGLEAFMYIGKLLTTLQAKLDQGYYQVNEKIKTGENSYITFNAKKDDSLIVKTTAVEKPDYETIAELIGKDRNIPVLEVLVALNNLLKYTKPLTHFKVKSKAKPPEDEIFIAGIFALGSDIGIETLAKSSKGLNANKLNNAVKWYFSIENLNEINDMLTDFMNHMSLPDEFKKDKQFLHTSSDGRKRSVSIESLTANYSYKYFGHGKGINIYTFVDKRGILFHSTVFSSSDRDAPYVIDGLLHNSSIKSDIHSTDTHGYSELIFAVSHLLGITFAPRIAKLAKQVLSSFADIKAGLESQGFKVLPGHQIKHKLIKDNWDLILRLIASIKSRNYKASTILNRLSSYSKQHPLQEAIKEFGKIIKSTFILNYLDDLKLRQSIQKQLNKGELSNKFSNAVSFAPKQEISQADPEDQEKAVICKMIIQNSIILWNYIKLTRILMNEPDLDKRKEMLDSIKESSILTWQHVNMHGTYDFTEIEGGNDPEISVKEILDFMVAA